MQFTPDIGNHTPEAITPAAASDVNVYRQVFEQALETLARGSAAEPSTRDMIEEYKTLFEEIAHRLSDTDARVKFMPGCSFAQETMNLYEEVVGREECENKKPGLLHHILLVLCDARRKSRGMLLTKRQIAEQALLTFSTVDATGTKIQRLCKDPYYVEKIFGKGWRLMRRDEVDSREREKSQN